MPGSVGLVDRQDGRCPATGLLLGACAAEVLRHPRRHEVAARRGGAAADRRTLRDRGRYPRPCAPRTADRCASNAAGRLVEAMHVWLTEQLGRISGRSTLAQAIRYALNHWNGLILFLDDGRLELDTNTVERAMRPVALGRKNALFAGADSGGRHWAIVATLIQTAKLNDVDPLAWLTDVLERIVSGRTKRNELDTLLPWNWKAAKAVEAPSSA